MDLLKYHSELFAFYLPFIHSKLSISYCSLKRNPRRCLQSWIWRKVSNQDIRSSQSTSRSGYLKDWAEARVSTVTQYNVRVVQDPRNPPAPLPDTSYKARPSSRLPSSWSAPVQTATNNNRERERDGADTTYPATLPHHIPILTLLRPC